MSQKSSFPQSADLSQGADPGHHGPGCDSMLPLKFSYSATTGGGGGSGSESIARSDLHLVFLQARAAVKKCTDRQLASENNVMQRTGIREAVFRKDPPIVRDSILDSAARRPITRVLEVFTLAEISVRRFGAARWKSVVKPPKATPPGAIDQEPSRAKPILPRIGPWASTEVCAERCYPEIEPGSCLRQC